MKIQLTFFKDWSKDSVEVKITFFNRRKMNLNILLVRYLKDTRMLKLFHVKVPGNKLKYDSYNEFVCTAYTEAEARIIHPSGCDTNWQYADYDWIQLEKTDILIVKEIGLASTDIPPHTVIMASYHSG